MRLRLAMGLLLAASALSATAGTITSLSPPSFRLNSGEEFLTVNGTGLGDRVEYSGPAGTFTVLVTARTVSSVTAWVPQEVLASPGSYTIMVRGSAGDSGPAMLSIDGAFSLNFTLLVPELLLYEAISREGTKIHYDVQTIGGEEDPQPLVECSPASDSIFKVGVTTVRCVASNRAGERAENQFSVNLYDAEPIVTVPGTIETTSKDPAGTPVDFKVSAVDRIDGPLFVSCNHKSGEVFPLGTTFITCSATDSGRNISSASFSIEVIDGTGRLTLHVPDSLAAEADSADGAIVTYEVTMTGTEDPRPEVKCDPKSESFFKFGITPVYCVATDRFGATAEGKFEVTVADTTAPLISIDTDPQYLIETGEMLKVSVLPSPFDVVDAKPRCSVTDVRSDQSGAEWKILSDLDVALLATRTNDTDRMYYIGVQCADIFGNMSTITANVPVTKAVPGPAPLTSNAPAKRRAAGGH